MEYTLWLDSLLGNEVLETLYAAYQTGDPGGEPAQKAVDLHRR